MPFNGKWDLFPKSLRFRFQNEQNGGSLTSARGFFNGFPKNGFVLKRAPSGLRTHTPTTPSYHRTLEEEILFPVK